MNKLRNMQLFCRVAELGNFSRVAQETGVPPAIIGRHMTELEEDIGVRLFNRSTRSVKLTAAGEEYYLGCKDVIEQVQSIEQNLRVDNAVDPSGTVRISAPEALGSPILMDFIEAFSRHYAKISFDLILENEHTDILSQQVDVAIRFAASLEDSSLVVQKLAATQLSLYAAPDYLSRKPAPKQMADLHRHRCIHFGISRNEGGWPVLRNGKVKRFRTDWKLTVGQSHAHHDAIVRGFGIGLALDLFAAPYVAEGKLTRIEVEESFPEVGIFAVYPSRRLVPRKTTLVVEHLKGMLAAVTSMDN